MQQNNFNKQLGIAIMKARIQEGISREELAGRCSMKFGDIKRIEMGFKHPPIRVIDRIHQSLKYGNCIKVIFDDNN